MNGLLLLVGVLIAALGTVVLDFVLESIFFHD